MGLVALQHVGSSRTRARTHVPCIGRRVLNHCATREVPPCHLCIVCALSGSRSIPNVSSSEILYRAVLSSTYHYLKLHYLPVFFLTIPCGMRDLSPPARDGTRAPCSGCMESEHLDHQGSPLVLFDFNGSLSQGAGRQVPVGELVGWFTSTTHLCAQSRVAMAWGCSELIVKYTKENARYQASFSEAHVICLQAQEIVCYQQPVFTTQHLSFRFSFL